MLTTKTICALLLGGAIGVGGTVAVPKVKKVSARQEVAKPKGERALAASRPRVVRPEPAQPAPILDCPLIGSPFAAEPNPIALPMIPPPPLGSGTFDGPIPNVWGGGSALLPPPNFPGAVPEPDAWALWIGGFGLVGLSFRRRRVA